MHHGTIVGRKDGARVVDDCNCKFSLGATSICPHTANGKVPLCRKATERISCLVCSAQDTNPRGGKLTTLHLFDLGVYVGLICGAALRLRRSPSSGIPRRHRIKVESKLQIARGGNLRCGLCNRSGGSTKRSTRRSGADRGISGDTVFAGKWW